MENSTPPVRQHRLRRTLLAALVALATIMSMGLLSPTAAHAAPRDNKAAAAGTATSIAHGRVTGTLKNGTGAVVGTLNVTRFAVQNGKLVAVGKFSGTVTKASGKVVSGSKSVALPMGSKPVRTVQRHLAAADAPAAAAATSCQILDLVLGPLDLNLLGLVIHLDTVHLNITAQSGPGNLLGNLLCAVAGLLNGGTGLSGILNGLVALLNQLLGMLG
jgi:hypothetical protein